MRNKFAAYKNELLFVPLGGSNEIGMNLNLYQYQGKWLIVDMGIGFANDYLPGIDVILPNVEFLQEIRDDIVGLVLTHAHEDHLGAVPYLWDEIHCPIYATPFTSNFLKLKLAGEGLTGKLRINEVSLGAKIELAPFSLEMLPLTHSIPEMHALAIRTDAGVIMHTGDWKLDAAPMLGPVSDEESMRRYGDEGVLAMVCDSTNVFVDGESGSEETVRTNLKKVIAECKNRVIVSTFASNIARVETILLAAEEAGRRVVLAGRSLHRVLLAAQESGYLKNIQPILSEKEAEQTPQDKLLILSTGCQGEPRAALTRMVQGSHPNFHLRSGDTAIFSARVIPGNEGRIRWLYNQLVRMGVEVITDKKDSIHVSGHPARGELERMYKLVRPKISVPVHGEASHLHEHVKLARSLNVPEAVEVRNGAVVLLKEGSAAIVDSVDSGYIAVDGSTLISLDSSIIRSRRKLRDDGNITISIVVDNQGRVMARPQITAPGSLDAEEDEAFIVELQDEIVDTLERLEKRSKITVIKDKVRNQLRRSMSREFGKKPVIEVHIHQI